MLEEDPNATPAHRPVLWQALGDTAGELSPEFIAVERDGSLIGGCGVVVERRGGLHWIHALPYLLSGAPLAGPGAHSAVDRLLMTHLYEPEHLSHIEKRDAHCAVIALTQEDSP